MYSNRSQRAAAVVFCLLLSFCFTTAAFAAGGPNWISISLPSNLPMVRHGKDIQKGDYWAVRIRVNYTNKKDSRLILKAIFDKVLTLNELIFSAAIPGSKYILSNRNQKITSNRVNKMEVWPGNSTYLDYYLPIGTFLAPNGQSWANLNSYIGPRGLTIRYKSWGHSYQVRSEKQ